MKIVHIVSCFQGGGIQNFILSLAPEQVSLGHDVTVICLEKYDYDYCQLLADRLEQNGVSVICLEKKRHNKLSLIQTLIKCKRLIRIINPEIVNTHGSICHFYGAISTMNTHGVRQIITVHNSPERWSNSVNLLCRRKPVIYCSESAYNLRVQKNKNIISIDNGISRKIVHSDNTIDIRKELGLCEKDKIVLLVGSMRPQKNYEFLKQISDEWGNKSIHFCICGGNYGKGYIAQETFKEYSNIHCLGLRSDVSAIENSIDLFMSVAKFEGLPIAVLEAYFNGVPCVLSPIPQHVKISDVDKVWIPEDFTARDYIATIQDAIQCNLSHDEIYEMRKEQLNKYSIRNTALKYISFYDKMQ